MIDNLKIHTNLSVAGKHSRDILFDVFVPGGSGLFPVIIFSHGFKGFKDWGPFHLIAKQFAEKGFVFIKFNFAFNGTTREEPLEFADLEAFGNNNFTKELDDLDTVITWAISETTLFIADQQKISLLGHSRGGGITILKGASDDRIESLATWASVADFSRFITGQDIEDWKQSGVHYIENTRTGQMMPLYLQIYYDFITNLDKLNIKPAVSRMNKPLLLIHGDADETVGLNHAMELESQNPENVTLITVEDGDHTFGAGHPFEQASLPPIFQNVVDETIKFFKAV